MWFSGLNEPITQATINVTDTDILDSSYAALHWIEGATNGLNFNNVRIDGAGTYALQVQAPGQASFTNVRATGIAQANPIHNCVGSGFQITQGPGNSGWYTPTPVCTGTLARPDLDRRTQHAAEQPATRVGALQCRSVHCGLRAAEPEHHERAAHGDRAQHRVRAGRALRR